MLRDLRGLPILEQQKHLDLFLNVHDDQNFPQEVISLYLDCSPWTLARMRVEQSCLPFTKIGRRVAYKKRDVLQYEQQKTVQNTAQLAAI